MSLAPIVLFVYNRPWHTRQTVSALLKNELAFDSDLFVFVDGPKNADQAHKVQEVREYVRSVEGFKSVTVVERSENLGLSRSVITGVTEIVNRFGTVIVLEDDLVTSPHFLKYMNDALKTYRDNEEVISIHGYIYPVKGGLPETFFLKDTGCWGWATWKRRWALFQPDGRLLLEELTTRKMAKAFDMNGSYPFTKMLRNQIAGKNDSWAIRWQASAFLLDKLTLFPGTSLVRNIGFDGSGIHGGNAAPEYDVALADGPIHVEALPAVEDSGVRHSLERYFRDINSRFKLTYLARKLCNLDTTALSADTQKYRHGLLAPLCYHAVKHFYKFSTNSGYRSYHLLASKLSGRPRFTPCSTKVLDWEVSMPDSASFLSAYKEIFAERIYAFKTDSNTPSILDLGANIGLSVLFFKRLYPQARITAFEADPTIFSYLQRNVRGNGYSDVKLVNKAIWDEKTTLQFNSEGADGGRAALSGDGNLITVDTVDIREVLKKERFDFLKMDIEGGEERVFPACRDYLSTLKYVFVEYHSVAGKKQGIGRIVAMLADAGFRIHLHSLFSSPSPFDSVRTNSGFDMQLNVFAWKG